MRAFLIDAALLGAASLAFWALFSLMGGHLPFSELGAAVAVATVAVLYAQYFTFFSYFGGATPGMMLFKLRLVSFDGGEPEAWQLWWRGFGYVASAGTSALGFLWALWDEDGFTWQDRISRTYITAGEAEAPLASHLSAVGTAR